MPATTWEEHRDEEVIYSRAHSDYTNALENWINNGKTGTPPTPPGLEQPEPPNTP